MVDLQFRVASTVDVCFEYILYHFLCVDRQEIYLHEEKLSRNVFEPNIHGGRHTENGEVFLISEISWMVSTLDAYVMKARTIQYSKGVITWLPFCANKIDAFYHKLT